MSVFTVENIQWGMDDGPFYGERIVIALKAELRCRIQYTCKCGYDTMHIELDTEAKASDEIEAMRRCIERLLNHQYGKSISMNAPSNSCDCEELPHINETMVYNFSTLQEPFRSLFEEIFKDSTWTIQKKLQEGQKTLQ